jgi:hypothetical protein
MSDAVRETLDRYYAALKAGEVRATPCARPCAA